MTTRIIFLPGIMGTELQEGKGKGNGSRPIKRWFSYWEYNVRRLRLTPGVASTVFPGEPLRQGLKFRHFRIDRNVVYDDILNHLNSVVRIGGYTFHPFGYDWRLDIQDVCPILDEYIDTFYNEHDDELVFVAHSMGGLLAHSYCRWLHDHDKTRKVSKVVTIGTPWHGSPSAFHALKYGVDKACFPNPKVTAFVSRSCPSAVQLLPSPDYIRAFNHYLIDEDNRPMYLRDVFEHLKRLDDFCLADPESIHSSLHDSLKLGWPEGTDHYNLVGVGRGTIHQIHLSPDYQDSMLPIDGDATVPFHSAIPPKQYQSIVCYTEGEHQQLVKLPQVLEWVTKVILDNDYSGTSDVITNFTLTDKWTMHRIACPVEVFVTDTDGEESETEGTITTHQLGQVTYIVYNESVASEVCVEAYDYGKADIEMITVENQNVTVVERFPSIVVTPTVQAVIGTHMAQDGVRITEITVSGDADESTVTGVTVMTKDRPTVDPPRTRCLVKEIGEKSSVGLNYDYQGVKVTFSAKPSHLKSPILETLYRINGGNWHRYRQPVEFHPGIECVYGKNTVEFYSRDIFDNVELIRRREFIIETPKPQFTVKLTVDPETKIGVLLSPHETFLKGYSFVYRLNDGDEVFNYSASFFLNFGDVDTIQVKAKDSFGRDSDWLNVSTEFTALAEALWRPEGFDGKVQEIVDLLGATGELTCLIGGTQKALSDSIPKTARYIEISLGQVKYAITLLPKSEIYLDYHSEVIRKSDQNVRIQFMVYDADGNLLRDVQPWVRYSLIPIKNPEQDVYVPAVSQVENRGIFSFNIPVSHLSSEVRKIRVEFKDFPDRSKPLQIREFRLE